MSFKELEAVFKEKYMQIYRKLRSGVMGNLSFLLKKSSGGPIEIGTDKVSSKISKGEKILSLLKKRKLLVALAVVVILLLLDETWNFIYHDDFRSESLEKKAKVKNIAKHENQNQKIIESARTVSEEKPLPKNETMGSPLVEVEKSISDSTSIDGPSESGIEVLKKISVDSEIENILSDKVVDDEDKETDNQSAPLVTDLISKIQYDDIGRGLVFNCEEKHWACVDRNNYSICSDHYKITKKDEQKGSVLLKCYPFAVYDFVKDCKTVQKYNVDNKILDQIPGECLKN